MWIFKTFFVGLGPIDDFEEGPAYLTLRLGKIGGVHIRPGDVQFSKGRLAQWVAWRLPACVVKWCFERVWKDATTGQYADTDAAKITAGECLERWEKK